METAIAVAPASELINAAELKKKDLAVQQASKSRCFDYLKHLFGKMAGQKRELEEPG